jgi:hypothetical protein
MYTDIDSRAMRMNAGEKTIDWLFREQLRVDHTWSIVKSVSDPHPYQKRIVIECLRFQYVCFLQHAQDEAGKVDTALVVAVAAETIACGVFRQLIGV